MNDGVAAGDGGLEGNGIGKVANDGFACDAFEIGKVRGFPGKEAQFSALGGKGLRHMMADKTCCAGKEDLHSGVSGDRAGPVLF